MKLLDGMQRGPAPLPSMVCTNVVCNTNQHLAFVTFGFAIGFVVFDHIFRPSSEKLSQNAERIFKLAFENVGDRVNSSF